MNDPPSFGIEEEYFLVHPRSGTLVRRVPARFIRAAKARCGDVVTSELLQSQVEIASPVFHETDEASATLFELRRGLADIALDMGYRLIAAGTHPVARWQRAEPTRKPRYQRLIDDFKIVGRRNLLCGLHLHVAVPPTIDRVALMNRLLPWLPVFLALSTSSPFWHGARTGLLSYRQAAYDEWPRAGVPDFFSGQAEYDAFAALLTRQGAIRDASYLWWAIRPSLRFPTLELRIADCCTRVKDTMALAALFRCLVRAHLRRPELGRGHSAMTRRIVEENRWRAKRYGIEASFIDEHGDEPVPLAHVLDQLRDLLSEDAQALGCEKELARLTRIMALGTSAHQQLAVFDAQRAAGASVPAALRAVVDWLVQATVEADPE
jgi:glutamate---cysteine ligase / carboxylate-amine ligase